MKSEGIKMSETDNIGSNYISSDTISILEAAEVLASVTGCIPCEILGNEWLFECCENLGRCCKTSNTECWYQYLKHYKNNKV